MKDGRWVNRWQAGGEPFTTATKSKGQTKVGPTHKQLDVEQLENHTPLYSNDLNAFILIYEGSTSVLLPSVLRQPKEIEDCM